MQHCLGIDIVEITRIERIISRWGESFLKRVYTNSELELYRKKLTSLAVRFAAKEAVVKLLGAQTEGIAWKDIEILSSPGGKPLVYLYNKARNRAACLGLNGIAISLSHSRNCAIACAISDTGRG